MTATAAFSRQLLLFDDRARSLSSVGLLRLPCDATTPLRSTRVLVICLRPMRLRETTSLWPSENRPSIWSSSSSLSAIIWRHSSDLSPYRWCRCLPCTSRTEDQDSLASTCLLWTRDGTKASLDGTTAIRPWAARRRRPSRCYPTTGCTSIKIKPSPDTPATCLSERRLN